MKGLRFLFFVGMLMAACSPGEPTASDSGIQGQVLIGPTCPVVQVGMDCADKPYQASFTVFNLDGKKVARFQADPQGIFKFPLAPGDYILHPESPNTLPYAADQPFSVSQGAFTQLTVQYDSGIR